MSLVEEFTRFGDRASYHYADDSANEWRLARLAVNSAIKIFDSASADEQAQMRLAAKNFLWGSEFSNLRPEA